MKEEIYDLIIIGAGPAGITAAIYAKRQRLNLLLIAKEIGGQINRKAVKIENFPGILEISGKELIERFLSHLKKYEIKMEIDEVTEVKKKEDFFSVKTKQNKEFLAKTIIVASGATPRPLSIPGEKEFLGKGVSYCVTCDAPLFKGKKVAVIGGGNAGFEAAIFLANFAEKIYILEFFDKVRAEKENQEKAQRTGKIEVITNAQVKEIKGDNFVKSLIYQDRISQNLKELSVDGVFVEIGNIPATSFVKDLVDFNKRNEIIVEFETMATKTPGIFAAGDCNAGRYKQIITACGEGAKAALSVYDYLQQKKAKD